MAEIRVRPVADGEGEAFARSMWIPFLDPLAKPFPGYAKRWIDAFDISRRWAAEDSGRFVGQCAVKTMDVTVPAGPDGLCPLVAMGGVTNVGVLPTHRRRGILRRMMATMLDDCRSRQEPIAGLIASESLIYGRYGFGHASDLVTWTIDRRDTAFLAPVPEVDLALVETDEAAKVLPDLHERLRTLRPGDTGRSEYFWREYFLDDPAERSGASALMIATAPDGYVAYRVTVQDGGDTATLLVEDLRAADERTEAALWQYIFGVDLITTITAPRRPLDDPLRWRLADSRLLAASKLKDMLHLRILDVPDAFNRRSYLTSGRLVIEVTDPPVPTPGDPAVGRFVIEGGPDGAGCRAARPGEDPDLALGLTVLGSLYLGGFPASLLARAGLVHELTPGALVTADLLLGTRPSPWTATSF